MPLMALCYYHRRYPVLRILEESTKLTGQRGYNIMSTLFYRRRRSYIAIFPLGKYRCLHLLVKACRKNGSVVLKDMDTGETDGIRYLVLGSKIKGAPAILLYEEEEGNWSYKGPLLLEEQQGTGALECPDFSILLARAVLKQ